MYLGIGQRESRHLGSHLYCVLLLLQTHLPLLLLLLEALNSQLSLHLKVLLEIKEILMSKALDTVTKSLF